MSILSSTRLRTATGALLLLTATALPALKAEERLMSPDGTVAMMVSASHGLTYRVEVDGRTIVTNSPLGLDFKSGVRLGQDVAIVQAARSHHHGSWKNSFGQRRLVADNWNELRVTLREAGPEPRVFGLVVRVYDCGVAFRYDLPDTSGLGHFVLTNELTEFRFAGDYPCWAGGESDCAETQYPATRLSAIPSRSGKSRYQSVLPLLVQAPGALVAIAEADLLDWAGMSLTGTGAPCVGVTLAQRADHNGLVASEVPRHTPWRVLMIARDASSLVDSDLIANLATPCSLKDISWIKPGACAWDSWWTGVNRFDPDRSHRGAFARGTTPSHKEYIDFAADMGWPYQLVDWFWYQNMTSFVKNLHSPPNEARADFTQSVPEIDLPALTAYAKSKNVRLLIWAHSLDVETFGIERTLSYLAGQGFAGIKIDFLNSQSQETVQWCERVLAAAARRHLLVDFHGTYKPAGLARTYPNFITQEGVLGNEYNKLPGNSCTPLHTITLPFTRGLLGPMDFTPGGFINRSPESFRVTEPAQVMGTRPRQLAMTVIYQSPLLVLCDDPANYRGQPGLEFLRHLPTVWEETVVLQAEVARSLILARRANKIWYLAAMNGNEAAAYQVPLRFLSRGPWTLQSYSDVPQSTNCEAVMAARQTLDAKATLKLELRPAGGFVAILSPGAAPRR
jgi:alpha-glucosidase